MMKLVNVSKEFKNKVLFENCFLKLDVNGLYGIVGKNGSGKTTFLKMLQLKEQPSNGTIENPYSTVYVDVKNLVFTRLNVWENLRIICDDEKVIKEVMEEFFLTEIKAQPAQSLSMGEKVRLAIARTILLESQVILLDEPTANLDEKNRIILLEILKKISSSKIIIFTTNQEADLVKCDTILRIENKKVEVNVSDKGNKPKELTTKSYTNEKLLKKALGGYGYIYRGISIIFLLLFSMILSIYCIKVEDIVYNSYEFDKMNSYMLVEKEYLSKMDYQKIDKTMFRTQAVKASNLPFFLNRNKIKQSQIDFLRDFELLKRIPNTIYVHYESQKYNLADDEIVMTEDLYNLFLAFSQIQNSSYSLGDITLKIKNVENGSKFTRVDNVMNQNEIKVLNYLEDSLKKTNFDFDNFFSILKLHLFEGCSEVELRAKDIENAHIYLNRTTYDRIYQNTIKELPIKEEVDLASYKIIKNDFVDLASKHIVISTGFCESFIKDFRITDILQGLSPAFFEVGPNLKLYYQVAGVIESEEAFITFLDEDYINNIIMDNIKKEFDELFILKEESKSIFADTSSKNLIMVMQNYHKIQERLENMNFLLPSLKLFLIANGIILAIILLVFSLVPLFKKRHTIILLANSNRTLVLKRNLVFKMGLISLIYLFFSIILSIALSPFIPLVIYDIWSFDFVSWISIFLLYLIGYLWIEGTQKILVYQWIK